MEEEKTYSQMRQDFYQKYRQDIVPKLMPFEKDRIKLRTKFYYGKIIFIAVLFLGTWILAGFI